MRQQSDVLQVPQAERVKVRWVVVFCLGCLAVQHWHWYFMVCCYLQMMRSICCLLVAIATTILSKYVSCVVVSDFIAVLCVWNEKSSCLLAVCVICCFSGAFSGTSSSHFVTLLYCIELCCAVFYHTVHVYVCMCACMKCVCVYVCVKCMCMCLCVQWGKGGWQATGLPI